VDQGRNPSRKQGCFFIILEIAQISKYAEKKLYSMPVLGKWERQSCSKFHADKGRLVCRGKVVKNQLSLRQSFVISRLLTDWIADHHYPEFENQLLFYGSRVPLH
jgi:hypothetical protein